MGNIPFSLLELGDERNNGKLKLARLFLEKMTEINKALVETNLP